MTTTDSASKRIHALCTIVSHSVETIPKSISTAIVPAVDVLLSATQIHTVGVGKSGFVAMKFAASLMSLRYMARFMSAVDLQHGDAGVVAPSDVAVLISKSGETHEVVQALRTFQDIGARTIAITMNASSRLATIADVALVLPNVQELDDHGLLPTTSVVVAQVACDLLCMEMLHTSNTSTHEHLRSSHPQGAIGAVLAKRVRDIMHSGAAAPFIPVTASVGDALVTLSTTALGVVCVVDHDFVLQGILTDGDVRRLASTGRLQLTDSVTTVTTVNPVVVDEDASLLDALRLMEHRDRQLSALPVMKGASCKGVIRLHDIARLQV